VTEAINQDGNRKAAYSLDVKEEPEPTPPADGEEERCPVCKRTLLGIWTKGVLHIKHQGREWWVSSGVIGIRCSPMCGGILTVDASRYEVNIVSSLLSITNNAFDATNAALELANYNEINLADVEATGKNGTILKKDVEDYIERLVGFAAPNEGSE
jgi:hypothetical protein